PDPSNWDHPTSTVPHRPPSRDCTVDGPGDECRSQLAYSSSGQFVESEVEMAQKANPVVFIHGLWLHATSWAPWQDFFGDAGYDTLAPGWPGDQDTVELARAN